MISITQMSLLETASIALFLLNIWSFQELWFYSVDPRRSFSIFPRSIDIITILLLETTREDSPMCVLPQRKYSISSILKIHFGQRKELYAVGAPWAPTADLAESYYYCSGQIALEWRWTSHSRQPAVPNNERLDNTRPSLDCIVRRSWTGGFNVYLSKWHNPSRVIG